MAKSNSNWGNLDIKAVLVLIQFQILFGFWFTLNNQEKIIETQKLHTSSLIIMMESEYQDLLDEYDYLLQEQDSFEIPNNTDNLLSYEWMTEDHINLLNAIAFIESGNNSNAIGDDENALGTYQIWNVYWKDAVEHNPEIGGDYSDVTNDEYARSIILSYWDRYGERCNYSIEGLARIHNGGPNGHKKQSTDKYWEKIVSHL
jgi:hypothetical protein